MDEVQSFHTLEQYLLGSVILSERQIRRQIYANFFDRNY
jgi:hypothetical protein